MEEVAVIVALVVGVVIVSAAARRWRLPAPILLVFAGLAVSFVPGVPEFELDPELVLVVVLPPLLYATAIRSSLIDIRRDAKAIGSLAVGLVLATAVVVGFGLHTVVPGISLATALALGAVVAPPDAVATTAVARRSGLDRRTLTVLEGESLFNDATALVTLQVALLAVEGQFGAAAAAGRFLIVGARRSRDRRVAGLVLSWIRRQIHDTLTDSAFSLVAPFVAFIPAELLHVSGVVAVVVAGLILAHRSPADQDPQARLVDGAVWVDAAVRARGHRVRPDRPPAPCHRHRDRLGPLRAGRGERGRAGRGGARPPGVDLRHDLPRADLAVAIERDPAAQPAGGGVVGRDAGRRVAGRRPVAPAGRRPPGPAARAHRRRDHRHAGRAGPDPAVGHPPARDRAARSSSRHPSAGPGPGAGVARRPWPGCTSSPRP